ncbi:MAG: T9SS type A sorting domain-containing protein [Flavobacteriales bacterium]
MKTIILFALIFITWNVESQIQLDSMTICGQSSFTINLQNPSVMNVWMKQGEGEIVISPTMTVNSSGWYHVFSANPGGVNDTLICNSFDVTNNYTSMLNVPSGYLITGIENALWGNPNTTCSSPSAGWCNMDVTSIVSRSLIGMQNIQYQSGQFPDPCTGTQKYLFLKLKCSPFVHDSIYVNFLPAVNIQISDTTVCNELPVQITLPSMICDTTFQTIGSLTLPLNNTSISSTNLEQGQLYRLSVNNAVSYGGGAGNQADGAYSNYPLVPIENIQWRFNGNQYGTLMSFRPEPDGYNPNHIYYFYIMGDGNPQDFGAYDCCLGDNSGFYSIVIEKVIINNSCGTNYLWSNGQIGNSSIINPSSTPNILYIANGVGSCVVDTFMVSNGNSSSSQNQNATDTYTWPVNNQTYTQSGVYTDTLVNAAGCDSVITLNLSMEFTGLNEFTNSNVIVFPNPINDVFIISGMNQLQSIYIYDINGKILKSFDVNEKTHSLSAFKSGVYFIEVNSDSRTKVVKVIKN